MKKTVSIISIAAIAMVMVFSCSKENATDKPVEKQELTAYETHINKTLKDFKQKMEFIRANPNLKSGESVPADSAVWLLEATINFSHAFPNEYYNEFKTDTLTLTVARNTNGSVDINELTTKYDEMIQAVADVYHSSGFEEKGLAVVDLEEADITESEIEINVQVLTGDKSNDPPPPPPVNGPFEDGDDWWYGKNVGHCYDPGSILEDAADHLYWETSGLVPDPNGNYFFINEHEIIVSGGDIDFRRQNDTEDNYLDYYLYYSVEGTSLPFNEYEMLCIEWTEMNNYYSYLINLMFNFLPNQYLPNVLGFYGHSIVSFDHLYDYSIVQSPEKRYWHEDFYFWNKSGYGGRWPC
ncbi:MAG: hypothetical protein R2764_23410 [Bacteroidales bacterium]